MIRLRARARPRVDPWRGKVRLVGEPRRAEFIYRRRQRLVQGVVLAAVRAAWPILSASEHRAGAAAVIGPAAP